MNWMRENKTLASIIGVMVAGGLGLAAVLVMSYFGYSESLEAYQTQSNTVTTLKGGKVFPSLENVTAKDDAISEYEEAVGKLGTVLLALQQPVVPLSDTEFQAKLKQRIAETRKAAIDPATNQPITKLPKEFSFGFDSYNSNLPRSGEAATQLGDYLAAVDAVVNLCISSGVSSIDSIERSELAIEKGIVAPPPAPVKEVKKSPATKNRKGKQAAKKADVVKEIAKVVERRQLTLTFTCDQGSLQLVMNKLASPSEMLHFTVVRQLRVENEKQEGPLRGSLPRLDLPTTPAPTSEDGTTPAVVPTPPAPAPAGAAKTQVIEPAQPAAPDAQPVFGAEKLRVYMEIDLVRFLEPKGDESAAK